LSKKIILVEDDLEMQKFIHEYLEEYNYPCSSFSDPFQALEELTKNKNLYSLLILDLMLPKMDGFDFLKKAKKISDIPVIISSARADIGNKIFGYEIGADDYLAKPYEPRELILKIESILKRYSKNKEMEFSNIVINKEKNCVTVDNFDIELTKVEFEIFLFLIENSNTIISRQQIQNATSLTSESGNRAVDMHISNIRYKIGDDSKNPKFIKSIWGFGYKFIG
jgi:DNA-binding response OmpR family regulator